MFPHAGPRALWPVVFFLPWFLVGSAYLGEWALHRGARWLRLAATGTHYPLEFSAARLRIIALGLLLITAPLALADTVAEGQAPCPVTTHEEARSVICSSSRVPTSAPASVTRLPENSLWQIEPMSGRWNRGAQRRHASCLTSATRRSRCCARSSSLSVPGTESVVAARPGRRSSSTICR